jgi:FkbM family methyltransferase
VRGRRRFDSPVGRAQLHLRAAVKWALNYRGERDAIQRDYAFRLMRHATPVVTVEGDTGTYVLPTAGGVLARETYSHRGFDTDKLEKAVTLANRPGGAFIDVGANLGVTTVPALLRHGFTSAIAVEPSPQNVRMLRATLALNDLTERVHVVAAALSDATGEMDLELAEENWGDHRLRVTSEPGAYYEERRPTVRVPVTTLDDIAPPDTGMVWVDTQGHDAQVLAGGAHLLSRDVPVVIEFWPYGLRRAGGLPLLYDLIARHFTEAVDLSNGAVISADSVSRLEPSYPVGWTDLLLR